jgi:hypothetical protein
MALKTQAEHGDDIQVVFVECQGAKLDEVEAFALDHKWFGTSAVWTLERPVTNDARGLPNCIVLDADGQVVAMGDPHALHKDIEELIKSTKRSRGRLPDGMPKELTAAWKAFAKGDYGTALAETQALSKAGGQEALAEAAGELADRVLAEAKARVDRAVRMVEEGCFSAAHDAAKELLPNLGQLDEAERAKELLARLTGDELAAEVEAEKALAKLEKPLYEKGLDKGIAKRLEKVAEKHAGTKAGERAQRLAKLAAEAN